MTWLVLAFALQLSYTPNDTTVQYQAPATIFDVQSQIIADMDAELRAFDEHLYVGSSVGVPFWINQGGATSPSVNTGFGGWPSALQSTIRIGLRFGGFEVGYSHLCTHPVVPYLPLTGEQVIWDGFYDEFHVKFSGSVKLF